MLALACSHVCCSGDLKIMKMTQNNLGHMLLAGFAYYFKDESDRPFLYVADAKETLLFSKILITSPTPTKLVDAVLFDS
jgi:hypothetical protein